MIGVIYLDNGEDYSSPFYLFDFYLKSLIFKIKMINTIKNIDSDFFKIKLGTFNKKNPKTIFIEGSAYILPEINNDFSNLQASISKNLSFIIKKMLNSSELFDSKYISIVEIPVERIKIGKKTYMSLEYHLKQKKTKDIDSLIKDRKYFIDEVFNEITKIIQENGFKITKTK